MAEKNGKWFTAMLSIIIVLLGAVGTLDVIMHQYTMQKLQNITELFFNERNLINCRINDIDAAVQRVREKQSAIDSLQKLRLEREKYNR